MKKEEKELEKAYDETAEQYLFSRTKGKESMGFGNREIERPTMFKLVPKNLKNKKLLDIGCGPGIHLKEYVNRGVNGFGIDLSRKLLKLAEEYCPKGKFKVGSIYKINFKNESFDIITASFLLDHVKDLEVALKEVKRVLKKGGMFIFSVPHPIKDMFRDSTKRKKYAPSHTYFDKTIYYNRIIGEFKKFPGFPRTMQDYINFFLKNGFILRDFIESKPNKSWKKKYPDLNETYFNIPLVCFFKWEKLK